MYLVYPAFVATRYIVKLVARRVTNLFKPIYDDYQHTAAKSRLQLEHEQALQDLEARWIEYKWLPVDPTMTPELRAAIEERNERERQAAALRRVVVAESRAVRPRVLTHPPLRTETRNVPAPQDPCREKGSSAPSPPPCN